MVPMKIGKQLFYYFYMKFMMWLDYARSKFPIPWLRERRKNISSLHLEFLWQPEKNQKKKVVFPERREGGTVVLTERSEVKTVPPSVVRVKHSSEGFSLVAKNFSGEGIRFL